MSYDLMIVKSRTGERAIGTIEQVRAVVEYDFPRIDIDAGWVDGDDWGLEVRLSTSEGRDVMAIFLTPRAGRRARDSPQVSGTWEDFALRLAEALDSVL